MEKIKVLLEQIDEEIAQENASSEEKVEITPTVLTDIISELKESLAVISGSKDKETKEVARKKKKQIKELEESGLSYIFTYPLCPQKNIKRKEESAP